MLELQDVLDRELQERIISVSGGNPFVIDAICDMINTSDVSISDIEDLRADTLSEVRLKVWRKLFREAEGLHRLINRAGLVPHFDERIMRIIVPEMTPDGWDRLRRLSFVNMRSDGSFVLHDLAEDLVRAELSDGLSSLVEKVSDYLEKKYNEESDIALLGLALSVRALVEPKRILNRFNEEWANLSWRARFAEGLTLCDSIRFPTEETRAYLKYVRAHFLVYMNRIADGEHEVRGALENFEQLETITRIERKRYLALSHRGLGVLFHTTRRDAEVDEVFKKSIDLMNEVISETIENLPPGGMNLEQCGTLWWYAEHLMRTNRLHEAEVTLHESMKQWEIYASNCKDTQTEPDRRFFDASKLRLAFVYLNLGKLQEAQAISKALLEIVEEPFLLTNCYGILTWSLLLSNRPLEAYEWIRKDIDIIGELQEHPGLTIATHWDSISVSHQLGRYSEALLKSRETVSLAKDAMKKSPERFPRYFENSLRQQAVLLIQTGRIAEAEKAYNESLRLRRNMTDVDPISNDSQIARILNNRGVLFSS
jgi:tetratricopeptide (TPR) repeat protein